jgi:hypothetical protein
MPQAKFHDIATALNPDYARTGFITEDMECCEVHLPNRKANCKACRDQLTKRIADYVENNGVQIGDILFVGSTYQTRQEYGFYLLLPDRSGRLVAQSTEFAFGLPTIPEFGKVLQAAGVKYTDVFAELSASDEFKFLFFPDDEDEKSDIIASYTAYNLL